jgi:hypothetical protein
METRVQRKIEEMWLLFESAEEIHGKLGKDTAKLRLVVVIWKSSHKGQCQMSELADRRTEMMNKIIESRSREMAGKIRDEVRDAREEGDRLRITISLNVRSTAFWLRLIGSNESVIRNIDRLCPNNDTPGPFIHKSA